MEWIISIWILLFVAVGVALSIEVLRAHYDFRAERRAWATMIHNRRVNERIFYLHAKSEIMRRRG